MTITAVLVSIICLEQTDSKTIVLTEYILTDYRDALIINLEDQCMHVDVYRSVYECQ